MSDFYSFFSDNADATVEERQPQPTDVSIFVGSSSQTINVPIDEARSLSVRDLFQRYAGQLGVNTSRISGYFSDGTAIQPTVIVEPGKTYMAAATTDTKGA